MLLLDKSLDMRRDLSPFGFLAWFLLIGVYVLFLPPVVFKWMSHNHHLHALSIYVGILIGIDGFCGLLIQTIRRLRTMRRLAIFAPLILLSVLATSTLLPSFPLPLQSLHLPLHHYPVVKITIQVLGIGFLLAVLLAPRKHDVA